MVHGQRVDSIEAVWKRMKFIVAIEWQIMEGESKWWRRLSLFFFNAQTDDQMNAKVVRGEKRSLLLRVLF